MKKISFNKLGEYFQDKCEDYFNKFYSDDIKDYADDLVQVCLDLKKDKEIVNNG